MADEGPQVVHGQPCPVCHAKTLTLIEDKREVPYFGNCYLFSMTCKACKYHKADIEAEEKHDPMRYTLDISAEADMTIRVVKSAQGTIKIPHMVTVEGGEASNGYISNVEGVLNRIKTAIELAKESDEDEEVQKKAKSQLKKLQRVMWGQETMKLIIEDPTGNSAIISDKVVKSKI